MLEELGEESMASSLRKKDEVEEVHPQKGFREANAYLDQCKARSEASEARVAQLRDQLEAALQVASARAAEVEAAEATRIYFFEKLQHEVMPEEEDDLDGDIDMPEQAESKGGEGRKAVAELVEQLNGL
eukprot:6022071-Alexandrium_andersonii.AAC.1